MKLLSIEEKKESTSECFLVESSCQFFRRSSLTDIYFRNLSIEKCIKYRFFYTPNSRMQFFFFADEMYRQCISNGQWTRGRITMLLVIAEQQTTRWLSRSCGFVKLQSRSAVECEKNAVGRILRCWKKTYCAFLSAFSLFFFSIFFIQNFVAMHG